MRGRGKSHFITICEGVVLKRSETKGNSIRQKAIEKWQVKNVAVQRTKSTSRTREETDCF